MYEPSPAVQEALDRIGEIGPMHKRDTAAALRAISKRIAESDIEPPDLSSLWDRRPWYERLLNAVRP